MATINHDFLKTGLKWTPSEIQNLGFNFSASTPLYLYAQLDFLSNFANLGSNFQFTASADPNSYDQQDIIRFLLLDPSQLSGFSGDQTVNTKLVNSGNYRVSFSDVITSGFSENTNGELQLINHEGNSASSDSLGFFPGTTSASGDIIINYLDPGYDELNPGQKGYWLLLHELGHAVGGLEDVHLTAQAGTYLDNQKYTVMSYNGYNQVYTAGLSLLDIAALQDTYGTTNTTTRSGDTVYALGQGLGFAGASADDPFLYTIWDGGGDDTIDASGFNIGAEIDLREGHFSSIGKNALGAGWNFDVSANSNDPDPGNVSIAYGTEIENAIGTDHADNLIGNDLDNILEGGLGNDTINGGGGNDIIDGGAGDDVLDGGAGIDTYKYSLGDGNDTINDTDGLNFELDPGIDLSTLGYIQDNDDAVIQFSDGATLRLKDFFISNGLDRTSVDSLPGWFQNNVLPLINGARNEVSPLVLDLDGDGIELISLASTNAVYWDLDQDGMAEATGWAGADDGLLAYDWNGDGAITTAANDNFKTQRKVA